MSYVKYLTPREALGKFLAKLEHPNSSWEVYFNEEQREYWNNRADKLLVFIKEKGLM